MRVSEILSELRIGKVGANVSTVDRSAPWVKAGIKKSYDRSVKFNELETGGEKIAFLAKETNNFTSNSVKPAFVIGNERYPFKSFDPETGMITLKDPRHTRQKTNGFYKISADAFTFDRRIKSPSTSVKTYVFKADDVGERSTEDNPDFKVANPHGRTRPEGKLKAPSAEFNRRANNPFGM